MKYLIIGGVAGGATVAARLRRMDEKAEIILFERGKYVSYVNTILIFGVLYFLTLIYNLMQVKLANPIELLRGGNVCEKEPKSKWLIAIIGLYTCR